MAFPFLHSRKEGEQRRSGQSINASDLKWSSQLSSDQESWETPAVETCYFLAKQHAPGKGRAGSALLPSPLREEGYPALPANPTRQGRGKRPHVKGWCPQWAAELPALELQVQRELQSRGCEAATGIISSPHLPPFLSTPSRFPHCPSPLQYRGHINHRGQRKVYLPTHRTSPFPQTPWRLPTTKDREGESEAQERHMQAESR